MKPYFCAAQLFLVHSDEVDQKAVALSAVAGRNLVERETAVGVQAMSGDGDGDSLDEAIKNAVVCGIGGDPDHWKVVNVTTKNQYIFTDVLVF